MKERLLSVPSNGEKDCVRCKEVKPLSEFYVWKRKNGIAYHSYCKPCAGAISREARLKSTYNITTEEYDLMLGLQGGKCAICHKEPKRYRLHVDHRHKDGLIRGLLCTNCNYLLGRIRENMTFLRNADHYLSSPPASKFLGGDRFGTIGPIGTKKKRKKTRKNGE